MSKAIILVGISGAGKSTYYDKLRPIPTRLCSADMAMYDADGNYNFDPAKLPAAHAASLMAFVEGIQAGEPLVVADNTNTSMAELAPYAAVAMAYGAELTIVVLHVSPKVAIERNVHGTPAGAIIAQYQRLCKLLEDLPPWWNVEHKFSK